ncbi:unnamed protein product [Colias eurytheme]|nr:unnamed protein product [Colias eurytheme]
MRHCGARANRLPPAGRGRCATPHRERARCPSSGPPHPPQCRPTNEISAGGSAQASRRRRCPYLVNA